MADQPTSRDPILRALCASTLVLLAASLFEALWPSAAGSLIHAGLWIAGLQGLGAALFCLGTARVRAARSARAIVLANALVQGGLLAGLVFLEHGAVAGEASLAGYPPATAWFLFLFWPAQLSFLLVFAWPYRRWFHTAEDERRIADLLRTRGAPRGEER